MLELIVALIVVLAAFVLIMLYWTSPQHTPPRFRMPNFIRTSSWFNTANHRRFAIYWIIVIVGITIIACYSFSNSDAAIYLVKPPDPDDFYYYHDLYLNKTDLSNPNNVFDVRIRISSQTLSSQMPIQIHWINITQTQGENYDGLLNVIFPRAVYDREVPEGGFEAFNAITVPIQPRFEGFYEGSSSPAPTIRYTLQGCYNVEVATNTTGLFKGIDPYRSDCTELSIAGLEVRKDLELQRENFNLQNSIVDQNNTVIKISAYAFTFGISLGIIAIILNWHASRTRG